MTRNNLSRIDRIHTARTRADIDAIAQSAVDALRGGDITAREMLAVRRAARAENARRAAAALRPDATL